MSVKVMGAVWEMDLPHNEAWVLMAMADHAGHDGDNVYPSMRLLAWKTGYSTRQVQRVLRRLEEKGIIRLRNTEKGPRPRCYQILLDNAPYKQPLSGGDESKQSEVSDEAKRSEDEKPQQSNNRHINPLTGFMTVTDGLGDTAMSPLPRHSCVTPDKMSPPVDKRGDIDVKEEINQLFTKVKESLGMPLDGERGDIDDDRGVTSATSRRELLRKQADMLKGQE